MPDYYLSDIYNQIGTIGLLSLVLAAIGISFIAVSLDTKSTKYDVNPKMKVMSPGLFLCGMVLLAGACVMVVIL